MIEVFQTNVRTPDQARQIIQQLTAKSPKPARFTFDLEDCDRVFRAEMHPMDYQLIQRIFHRFGCHCEILTH